MDEKNTQFSEENREVEPLGDLDQPAMPHLKARSVLGTVGLILIELIKIFVLAGITVGLVRHFLFKPFYVKGASMEPTYYQRDYLIIDELSYWLREPKRGEVVVFEAPNGVNDFYLKRIIGLPGERVKIEDEKVVIYNEAHPKGFALEEPYLTETTLGSSNVALGEDQYYVVGDNRDESYDSRRFGAIDGDTIVGKSWLRGWPFSRMGVITHPTYTE